MLRRALEAVPNEGPAARCLEQTRGELQRALHEQAETGEANVAGVYQSVPTTQGLGPDEKAAVDLVARSVRDAVVMTVVKQAGGHGDMDRFNAALSLTFAPVRASPDEDNLLYAQVHMSYQVLFRRVRGAFISSSKRQGRPWRPARANRPLPQTAPAGGASGTEPEAEQVPEIEQEAVRQVFYGPNWADELAAAVASLPCRSRYACKSWSGGKVFAWGASGASLEDVPAPEDFPLSIVGHSAGHTQPSSGGPSYGSTPSIWSWPAPPPPQPAGAGAPLSGGPRMDFAACLGAGIWPCWAGPWGAQAWAGWPSGGGVAAQAIVDAVAAQARGHAHLHPESFANDEVAGKGEKEGANVAALGLRGLPFSATVQDVFVFCAQHNVADRIADWSDAVQLLPNANGRPSGQAVVQMKSRQDAEIAKDSLHGQYMDTRYIEVFICGGNDGARGNANRASCSTAAGQSQDAVPQRMLWEVLEAHPRATGSAAEGSPADGAAPADAGSPGIGGALLRGGGSQLPANEGVTAPVPADMPAQPPMQGQHAGTRCTEVLVHGGDDGALGSDSEVSCSTATSQLPDGGVGKTMPEALQEPAGGHTHAGGLGLGQGDVQLVDQQGASGGRAGEGRCFAAHVPDDLSCEEWWRCDVESLLASIVCPATRGAVCRACVKDLGEIMERSRNWLGDIWSQGSPGQHFCGHLLDTLSGAIQRFPEDTQMHGACIKMLCTVCEKRGDILGLQFPGPAQPEPSIEYMLATRSKVRAAVFTAQAADRSDSSILHEERICLLVRTQKLPDLLCALGEDSNGINDNAHLSDEKVLLKEAKNGLDIHIQYLAKGIDTNQHQDREQAKAFLKEVLKQQQRRSYHTQDWVQGGDFGCGREHSVDRFCMHMRFTVAGLLFGFEEQILTPIRTSQDTHMLHGALKAVRTMHAIVPLSESTCRAVVSSFRSIDWPLRRRNCEDSQELSVVWMECEATKNGIIGTLLKGSISQNKWPGDVIRWAVKEARDSVDHASSMTIVEDMQYHASVVSLALWCLIEMLDGAQKPSGDLAESVDRAAQQAVRHLAAAQHVPFARIAFSNALRLFEMVHGPTATPE